MNVVADVASWLGDLFSGFVLPAAAVIAAATAVLVAWFNRRRQVMDRRRTLYSEAYLQPLRWVELVYRVRRRANGKDGDLMAMAHDIQERIAYHEGWLNADSPALARSYCRFVAAVRTETADLLREAWKVPGIAPEQSLVDLPTPNVETAKEAFLQDVRDHLSPWPWVRWPVRTRNPKDKK